MKQTQPDTLETEILQNFFAALGFFQLFGRDPFSRRDSRCQTSGRRLSARRKRIVFGDRVDVVLRDPGFDKGTHRSDFSERLHSGPVVRQIVRVRSVRDHVASVLKGDLTDRGKDKPFAVIAAIRTVFRKARKSHHVRPKNNMGNIPAFRKFTGLFKLLLRHHRSESGDRSHRSVPGC